VAGDARDRLGAGENEALGERHLTFDQSLGNAQK